MIKTVASIIIWPIWAIVFLLGALLYNILMIVFTSKKIHPIARVLCYLFMISGAQWFQIRGNRPNKDNGPYLYLINHGSLFDTFMSISAIPHFVTGVGSAEQFSWPIWGGLATRYGLIPLERTKINSAVGSLTKLEDAIKKGNSAIIAPEGTRTLTGEMNEFKKGAFHVAKNTGVTIIPIALVGAYEAKNKNDWRIKPGKLTAIFGNPISEDDYKNIDINSLKDKVNSEIQKILDEWKPITQ